MLSMKHFPLIYQTVFKPMKSICYRIVILCWTILFISPSAANTISFSFDPNATCENFLLQNDPNAPDYFQYQRCDELDDEQGKPLDVWYKVEGKHAKQAEAYLIEKTGIGKLKHICCYWGPENGQRGTFHDSKKNLSYDVLFVSEETLSYDWQDVTFYLRIRVYRDDI